MNEFDFGIVFCEKSFSCGACGMVFIHEEEEDDEDENDFFLECVDDCFSFLSSSSSVVPLIVLLIKDGGEGLNMRVFTTECASNALSMIS